MARSLGDRIFFRYLYNECSKMRSQKSANFDLRIYKLVYYKVIHVLNCRHIEQGQFLY